MTAVQWRSYEKIMVKHSLTPSVMQPSIAEPPATLNVTNFLVHWSGSDALSSVNFPKNLQLSMSKLLYESRKVRLVSMYVCM